MKTFVIGDIHGNHKALLQCLERSKFDKQEDRLICLGDIVDGFPDTKKCVEELMTVKNIHLCIGNHDLWFLKFVKEGGRPDPLWFKQGGQATVDSYGGIIGFDVPQEHFKFLSNFHEWVVLKEMVFVHGGFDPTKSLDNQDIEDLVWDRQMVETAWKKTIRNQNYKFGPYTDVFVGHTPTTSFGIWDKEQGCIKERRPTVPLRLCNVWMMDTGAGWDGKLSIMDVETKEYFQSDLSPSLYPEGAGRGIWFKD